MVAAGAVLGAGLCGASGAQAITPLDLLLSDLDARIAEQDALVAYGQHRATERMNELRLWIGWWESVQEVVRGKQDDLAHNFQYRVRNADAALALLRSITDAPDQSRNLPGFGWMSVDRATAMTASLAVEASRLRELISEGLDNWFVVVVGWTTSDRIKRQIEGLRAEIESIHAASADGDYRFHVSPHAWTSIARHRDRAAALREERAALEERFRAGEYTLRIPGIGNVNRNQLQARIDDLEARIDTLRKQRDAGELSIHRPALGGMKTRAALVQEIDEAEASLREVRTLISDGLFGVHLAGLLQGRFTRRDVEERIDGLDKAIGDVTEAIRTGDYRASVRAGHHSLNTLHEHMEALERRLDNPNLTDIQRNQILEQLERSRKSIAEWRQISAFDLMIKGAEKVSLTGLLPQFMRLARPEIEHRELKQKERLAHLPSFDLEFEMRLRVLQDRLAHYREGMKWFVSG